MKKILCSIPLVLCIVCVSGFASQINRISLSELHAQADLIVMGQVTDVAKKENRDHVTITAGAYLKGSDDQKTYTFTLITRGGLKDFDPALRKGDTGVFFLKRKAQKGRVEKAYWGSAAIFQKNHFYVSDRAPDCSAAIDLTAVLDRWRSYRVKYNQIRNIDEYERGFRKGFGGPPGLVDGSADFNLGHSDGMLAKKNVPPHRPDADDST